MNRAGLQETITHLLDDNFTQTWGLFLESSESFSGPKSHSSNAGLLIL